jgi:hypothetical protein
MGRRQRGSRSRGCPATEPISSFAEYCQSTYWADPSLGLDMVERFIPLLIKEIENEPAETFREFDDVAWHVLKGIDILGIYAKKHRQTKREAAICRNICEKLDAEKVGERLSHVTKRQFQPGTWLLDFLRRAAPDVFKTVVRAIDWSAIDATIGEDWENLFHDGETFLHVASADIEVAKTIAAIIDERLKGATVLSPRLAMRKYVPKFYCLTRSHINRPKKGIPVPSRQSNRPPGAAIE